MNRTILLKSAILGSVCIAAIATASYAEEFNIGSGDLKTALGAYTRQTGASVIVSGDAIKGVSTKGVRGDLAPDAALSRLLSGTGFMMKRDASGAFAIVRGDSSENEQPLPAIQLAQADRSVSPMSMETVTVTAQKVEENIQLVPIAVTALSQEQLQAQKIEGGPDLLKSVPNMTFSKNNFSGYNIEIRGVGTKAVSVTTDPGVAVSFNDTALIRNRFFEQEFFDMERVETLRGPQGTLYGRNATGGVVNLISAKPTDQFEGEIRGEVGNYDSKRLRGFVNVPIIGDKLDLRLAGSLLRRDGYDFNATTDQSVNGRDLWSTRATLGFKPTENLHGYLIWEHFNENDDRSRTGKQLCHRDPGPSSIGSVTNLSAMASAALSQGCLPGSLYDTGAFGTPNGLSLPFVLFAQDYSFASVGQKLNTDGTLNNATNAILQAGVDPYGGKTQSTDLRTIASIFTPKYRAKSDVYEFNVSYDISPSLSLTSETAYNTDNYYSSQDYNRFNTGPVFTDTSDLYVYNYNTVPYSLQPALNLAPGGVFCDPQLGCSNSIAGLDVSQAKSDQFSQEVRLQSSSSGPLNFSLGANYTRYHTVEDYYVFFNILTAITEGSGVLGNGSTDPTKCTRYPLTEPTTIGAPGTEGCMYIDPNPLSSLDGQGHNYYRSSNPYTLSSGAAFGEVYWQAFDDLKFIAGLRYTDDNKTFTPIPSQLLLSSNLLTAGVVDKGYPEQPDIKQHWGEFTGRFGAQWTPKTSFTDQTMIYATYSRGYKGGGANPPGIGFSTALVDTGFGMVPLAATLPYSPTFKPEFVNAFEVGTKNSLLDDSLILNGDVFFYDYKDYQISQIVDRTAVNENFDAKMWGAELEATWEPLPGLRFNFNGGYQGSRLADGSKSIDLMNRTQGNPDYMILKGFVNMPSNCVIAKSVVEPFIRNNRGGGTDNTFDSSGLTDLCPGSAFSVYQDSLMPPGSLPNDGQGFYADLGGNELPNMPHFTMSLGAQYAMPLSNVWTALARTDFYWQTNSWARVYNDQPYDVLHGWTNLNVTLDIIKSDGLQFEVYVKNVFNKTAITDAFLNSDDTALTTNVFVTDPRLIGFSVTKSF